MAKDTINGGGPDVAASPAGQDNAISLCVNAIDLAQRTLFGSFDVARQILEIKDPAKAVELQLAHARSQIAAYDAHIRELGRLSRG